MYSIKLERNIFNKIIYISGPTASGKSFASTYLGIRWPIEIVNIDSTLVYKCMNIGTSKPKKEEKRIIKHHLIDIRDPSQVYSLSDFFYDVNIVINQIIKKKKIPLLVGGTIMYYKFFNKNLFDNRKKDIKLRFQIIIKIKQKGLKKLYYWLCKLDANISLFVSFSDKNRIRRSIEICILSGYKLSDFYETGEFNNLGTKEYHEKDLPLKETNYKIISLEPSNRIDLYIKIEKRLDLMLKNGLINEIKKLKRRNDLHKNLPSINSIGYKQYWNYLDGIISYKEAKNNSIVLTKNLVKNQLILLQRFNKRKIIDCSDIKFKKKLLDTFYIDLEYN